MYAGTCQWFMFDGTTSDCKLFSSPLNDLWNDCREVGYAREPQYDLCDQVFSANSTNGCYVSMNEINTSSYLCLDFITMKQVYGNSITFMNF